MSKLLEAARRAGDIDSYSADEAVGIVVNQLMFERRITRVQLGQVLGVTPAAAGRKLRGDIGWSLTDLFRVGDYLGIDIAKLLPHRVPEVGAVRDVASRNATAGFQPNTAVVGRAGLEPATQGL